LSRIYSRTLVLPSPHIFVIALFHTSVHTSNRIVINILVRTLVRTSSHTLISIFAHILANIFVSILASILISIWINIWINISTRICFLWLGGCNTFVFMFILLLQLRYFLGGIVFKFAFRNRNGLYFFFLNNFWLGFDELFLIDWSVLHQHFRFFINVFNDHVEPLCHFIHFKLVLLFVVFFI
jgi:hypothetical protein